MKISGKNKLIRGILTVVMVLGLMAAAPVFADNVTPTAKPAVKAKAVKTKRNKTAIAMATAVPAPTEIPAVPETVTSAAAAAISPVVSVSSQTATAGAKLTFEDCYNLAAEKNRDFKIAKLDKSISEAQLSRAAGAFGPSINISGSWDPENVTAPLIILPGAPGYSAFAKAFSVPEGTPLSISLSPDYYYAARISLTQPVFTFGKTYNGFKMADEAYQIALINYKKATDKLNLDVMNSFYGALIAQEMANTLDETMRSNEEYLRITKTKYQNGQASNFDVLQAQVQYANSIPDAQRAEDGAKLSLQMLKNTLGLPLEQDIQLSGEPEYKKLEYSYEDLKKKFKENNSDMKITEHAANLAKYQKNLQESMFLPNIAINANYSYTSSYPAFHHESMYWQNSWDVSLGFQWTVFDSFKNVAAMKEACANNEKAQLNKENADNMLTIQLDQLYTSLDQNGKIIEAAGDLIKTAEEGYRIAKESYKNGLIQSVDLLNAETGMLHAKMNYLNAMFNYITTAQKLKDFVN